MAKDNTPAVFAEEDPALITSAPLQRVAWEIWASQKGVPHWKADAARIGRQWPLGQEVTEDEFNQAVYDAFNSRIA
jgi:hypothetical protein